jgi:hypothetical protein
VVVLVWAWVGRGDFLADEYDEAAGLEVRRWSRVGSMVGRVAGPAGYAAGS